MKRELQRIANEKDGRVISRHITTCLLGVETSSAKADAGSAPLSAEPFGGGGGGGGGDPTPPTDTVENRIKSRPSSFQNRIDQLAFVLYGDLSAGTHEMTV